MDNDKDNYDELYNEVKDVQEEIDNTKKKKRNRKKKRRFLRYYACFATLAVGVLGFELYKDKMSNNTANESEKTQEVTSQEDYRQYSDSEIKEIIKSHLKDGDTVVQTFREIYPEDVVFYHGGRYLFYPVIDGLKKNTLDNENIKLSKNGEISYEEEGKVTSEKIVDVSKFQGEIDWEKVKKDGVDGAIIRVGNRGYGAAGKLLEDEYAKQNLKNAKKAGIKVGAYFYSQAITEEEVQEEVKLCLDVIKDYSLDYPVYYDTEASSTNNGRADDLTAEERTKYAKLFCDEVKKAGYDVGIYSNLKWFIMSLDMEQLEDYDKWIASYDTKLYFPYKVSMWQYSETGSVDGITGNVDMNVMFH